MAQHNDPCDIKLMCVELHGTQLQLTVCFLLVREATRLWLVDALCVCAGVKWSEARMKSFILVLLMHSSQMLI